MDRLSVYRMHLLQRKPKLGRNAARGLGLADLDQSLVFCKNRTV